MSAVDDYLAKVELPLRIALERVREIVKKTVPEAEEVLTHGLPSFRYKGKYLLAYGSFKDNLSVFPASAAIEELSIQLSAYKTSRGTIQFTLKDPLPEVLIIQLVNIRLASIKY